MQIRAITIKIRKKKFLMKIVKFLGVLLDSSLSWKHHIVELSKKIAGAVEIFYKVRHHSYSFENSLLLIVLLFCFLWNHCLRLNT